MRYGWNTYCNIHLIICMGNELEMKNRNKKGENI